MVQPKTNEPASETQLRVVPLVLGPRNTEAATGWPYRWVRDQAEQLGVPFIGTGRKRGVRADLFLAALERGGAKPQPSNDSSPPPAEHVEPAEVADPAEQVRRMLGKRLKHA